MPKFCIECGSKLIAEEIEGHERLACVSESCNYIHWDNPIPVVAGLIEYNGNVLLARNKEWPEKVFSVITGFLEKGESPEEGIIRETKEELGLEGTIESLIGVYHFEKMNQVIIAYHITATGVIFLGDEIAETKEISPEKLKGWDFGTGFVVKDWLANRNK